MGLLIPLDCCQLTVGEAQPLLTIIQDVIRPIEALGHVDWPEHTLVAQVSHEELETDEGKDAQAEDGQDHHIRKLLHRLDQGAHNGLQALHTSKQNTQLMQEKKRPRYQYLENLLLLQMFCFLN